MHHDKANLANLIGLWKKYGARPIQGNTLSLLQTNTHWPHRCWFDRNTLASDDVEQILAIQADAHCWLDNVPESAIFPLLPQDNTNRNGKTSLFEPQRIEQQLLEKGWVCAFEQTAMYLELQHLEPQKAATDVVLTRTGLELKPVRTAEDITQWGDIGSEAFSYHIDRPVIEKLVYDKDIQLLIGRHNDQAIATALLYKTGDIIGIHQVGVKPNFQGKGFAKSLMQYLIAACVLWQGQTIVLQASQAGKPLYDSLGFKPLFLIKNYHRA